MAVWPRGTSLRTATAVWPRGTSLRTATAVWPRGTSLRTATAVGTGHMVQLDPINTSGFLGPMQSDHLRTEAKL
jgi:hypothetical protein